jgi:glycerophosphoryl diester phosphodiesterase
MRKILLLLCAASSFIIASCSNENDILFPGWPDGGFLVNKQPIPEDIKHKFEGVYVVEQGKGRFGDTVVVKWNREHLGIHAGVHVAYLDMESGTSDSTIYLQGYWRYQNAVTTGLAQLVMGPDQGGRFIYGDQTVSDTTIRFRGKVGENNATPSEDLVIRYVRPFSPEALARKFYIINHHGSGSAPDYLPASENTCEIAKLIERYGANSIEIDIRPTQDGIPVLYHDSGLNWRLTQKGQMIGAIEDYTFAQVQASVRLLHGEKIPSLEQFLDTVIMSTTLELVYVDMKPTIEPYMQNAADVVTKALEKAKSMGRDIQIYLAITTDDLYNKFISLPNYQNISSMCELSLEQLEKAGSKVWSPRWTSGFSYKDVDQVHAAGKIAVTWTVNLPSALQEVVDGGKMDGVLTDFPTLASYYYYKQ